MSRVTRAGLTAGVAVALACASLSGPSATASKPGSSITPKTAATTSRDASPDKTFSPASRAQATRLARAEAASIAKSLKLTKAQDLHVADVERDADGTLHLRYTRTLRGLQVIGGDFVVHQAPTGVIEGTDFASTQPLTLRTNVATRVTPSRATALAAKALSASPSSAGTAKKIVWAVDGVPRLAWLTQVRTADKHGNVTPTAVVVDARTGAEIQRWSLHQTAKGKGNSLYSGRVRLNTVKKRKNFVLKDTARGGSTTVDMLNKQEPVIGQGPFLKGRIFADKDNVWGNGTKQSRQSAAVDVAYGAARTWDYYQRAFHRKGIANNGKGAKSRVHYGKNYNNAFWSDACFCMTYGDGAGAFNPLVALDVAGHEMTHGVTSHTAGLLYFGDSGGLNESTSDIFGTMVEFSAKNKFDKGDYYIGEEVIKPGHGKYLRRMDNPRLDSVSRNCWAPTMGLIDVHLSSGVGNHFFYLLAEGSGKKTIGGLKHNSPRCAGAAPVKGIGRAKAADIWYRALTRYFVSTTGYIDARDATIHAAIDLYGENSAECRQVVKAWNAVDVVGQYWNCSGKLVDEGPNSFGASPGFEIPNASWTVEDSGALIDNGQFSIPRTGNRNGLLNSFGQESDGTLSHQITVPDTDTATLRFYMFIDIASSATGSVTSGTGTVDVYFNGNLLAHFDETYANRTYQRWDIPLTGLAGELGELSIVGHEDNPSQNGGYFAVWLDDFTLTER
jgi:Zn-dependent metalloprotease